jgi:hypothetical protein
MKSLEQIIPVSEQISSSFGTKLFDDSSRKRVVVSIGVPPLPLLT